MSSASLQAGETRQASPESEPGSGNAGADGRRKRLAGLRAQMALRGPYIIHELAQGGFLVVWHGLSREARDLDDLEAFARRVGAVQ